ncbi:ATP-binding cassette subfamily F protein 3 [Luteibacter rhizovicinus]|uniref:Probable ATP-binding protein YheS n=1 Tax=Luteibacter rhizovicinus TaxID=242606 RepID=A0A4R3YX60_9GAMM|nr:ATP-binding cassette domain-containing protein [Luteibacter rhizovicinus]TCV97291.1 ATP-binding cassette subfamily F protein 3 [Luteibacter rhizovicinus]
MISFRQFALRRGSRTLLSNVDVTLQSGWSLGVVGRNGCGKSSLFAALKGELEPELGDLDMPSRIRLAAVDQETPALPDPAIEYVLGGDVEVATVLRAEAAAEAAGDHEAVAAAHIRIEELNGYDARARAGRLLHGLGFPAETHERPVASFSGGWRVRLNLARALMAPSDLLLLDEPTNHLDLDAVLWLEEWLRRYPGTLLVISHDREFMDGVISHTLHLHDGTAKLYTGDYTAFERQRAEHLRQQQVAHEREQAERAHLQSFIDRFKAKASKAKQAQSRVKRLEKLAGTEAVRAERGFSFSFAKPEKLPTSMLRLDHVDAGYGDHLVLRDVGFGLEAGDRIGLLGPNGAGKSTLVKSLVGDLDPLSGERAIHRDLRIGYFAQHTVESLREGASPFDHLQEKAPGVGAQALRDFLGTWNFPADRAFEPVDDFSGGERARLALALIAWDKPNLLLLDEPTNHLDLDMREALADALAEFDGALVLVSHDRHLLGMVCDEFWRVADGTVEPFDGDLDDYAKWLRSRATTRTTAATSSTPPGASYRDRRKASAGQREKEKPLRARIKKIEALVETLDKELNTIQTKLADPAVYEGPTGELMKLGQRQGDLRREKEELEAEWMGLLEQIEA